MEFLIIIAIVLFIMITGMIGAKISDKKLRADLKEIDDKYNKIFEDKKKTISRLNEALTSLCGSLNISLSYHDSLGEAAGRILYHSDIAGRLILDKARIEILNRNKDTPYVLAHELGHYMAIKQRNDQTEEGADLEALNLCRMILTPEEQGYIADELKIYFGNKLELT